MGDVFNSIDLTTRWFEFMFHKKDTWNVYTHFKTKLTVYTAILKMNGTTYNSVG